MFDYFFSCGVEDHIRIYAKQYWWYCFAKNNNWALKIPVLKDRCEWALECWGQTPLINIKNLLKKRKIEITQSLDIYTQNLKTTKK